jgi:hypothetical protein
MECPKGQVCCDYTCAYSEDPPQPTWQVNAGPELPRHMSNTYLPVRAFPRLPVGLKCAKAAPCLEDPMHHCCPPFPLCQDKCVDTCVENVIGLNFYRLVITNGILLNAVDVVSGTVMCFVGKPWAYDAPDVSVNRGSC